MEIEEMVRGDVVLRKLCEEGKYNIPLVANYLQRELPNLGTGVALRIAERMVHFVESGGDRW